MKARTEGVYFGIKKQKINCVNFSASYYYYYRGPNNRSLLSAREVAISFYGKLNAAHRAAAAT